jgi:methylmalonyl-CoA/ethylmalonyl-CoA epimerase
MYSEFLGKQIEVALVSADFHQTLADLCHAGIGPWRIYTIHPGNTTEQTYRGRPAQYAMKVCFAEHGGVVWEVIQPLWGPSIFQEYLDQGGSGFQHLAYDCSGLPFAARLEGFSKRGFDFVQGGNWLNGCQFAFFMPTSGDGICLETIAFDNWEYPDPEEIYPLQSG